MDKIHIIGISGAVLFIVSMIILGIQSKKKKTVKSRLNSDGLPHGRYPDNPDYW